MVDTIREEEKYGNTGDKFNRFGRAVVNGVEKMTNLVNSALNVRSLYWIVFLTGTDFKKKGKYQPG